LRALFATCLLGLAACSSQPASLPDYFAARDDFSAARARETTLIRSASTEQACAQVVDVLMDLDCRLQEVDSRLGLVSAYSSAHSIFLSDHGGVAPADQRSCAGRRVTVTVIEKKRGEASVRATFRPSDPRADETFRALLRKSLSVAAGENAKGG
jgi:hypothetical protein